MWRNRYKKEFKYDQPNMFITAVRSFPHKHNSVEAVKEYYEVEKNQYDPIRMEIVALSNINSGCNFIPICFEDQEPKLLDFKEIEDFKGEDGWFWCVGYRSPCYTPKYAGNGEECGASINYPDHKTWRKYLEYSLSNLGGMHSYWLFEQSVKYWVYEQTAHWTDRDKSRRFMLIENTSLECLSYGNSRDICHKQLPKERYLQFLDLMYDRDIYEFIFHEFKTRVC